MTDERNQRIELSTSESRNEKKTVNWKCCYSLHVHESTESQHWIWVWFETPNSGHSRRAMARRGVTRVMQWAAVNIRDIQIRSIHKLNLNLIPSSNFDSGLHRQVRAAAGSGHIPIWDGKRLSVSPNIRINNKIFNGAPFGILLLSWN